MAMNELRTHTTHPPGRIRVRSGCQRWDLEIGRMTCLTGRKQHFHNFSIWNGRKEYRTFYPLSDYLVINKPYCSPVSNTCACASAR
jgi:hypothetical protein